MKKILKNLYIVQEISNKKREIDGLPSLGKGYFKAYRFNPYNPLSYVALIIIFFVGIIMFGFYGFWREIDMQNPFKWN